MMKFHYLFHAIVYYGAWFLGLKLAADGDVWQSSLVIIVCVFLQVGWQYQIQHHTRGLWYLMGLIVIISTVVDSLLVFNGLVIYKANPFAPYLTSPWMIAIWVSFAVTLYATLSDLFNHLTLLGLLSFVGFALAYAIGAKMGAAFFPDGYKTCLLIGVIWLVLFPFVVHCYQKMMDLK